MSDTSGVPVIFGLKSSPQESSFVGNGVMVGGVVSEVQDKIACASVLHLQYVVIVMCFFLVVIVGY